MQRDRPKTEEFYRECCKLMPGGVSSPARAFKGLEMTPLVVCKGNGEMVTDVDGHEYIDLCQSFGALILGHSPLEVMQKVAEQLYQGTTFGIATQWEKELAEKIISHFPSIESLRFVSSGTEAVMTAIRLARGYTGKSLIVKFNGHFHGHSDSLLIQAGSGGFHLPQASSLGIPDAFLRLTASLPFNDLNYCRDFIRSRDDIAAVLLEPISGNMGVVPSSSEFLQMLREECSAKGIVLIFDEVITGFRVGLKGAQGLYGITPDLTCLGKVVGGGFPAAAFGGKREIMEQIAPLGSVYQAGTLSGNPLAMRAGFETLQIIEQPLFFEALEEKTEAFLEPIREVIARKKLPMAVQSAGSMFTLFFGVEKVTSREDLALLDERKFKEFFHYLFHRGIYLSPSPYEAHFICGAHTQESLKKVQNCILDFISA